MVVSYSEISCCPQILEKNQEASVKKNLKSREKAKACGQANCANCCPQIDDELYNPSWIWLETQKCT